MKFQNYWGQIVAAEDDEQIAQCEKLIKLIGQFREHATQ